MNNNDKNDPSWFDLNNRLNHVENQIVSVVTKVENIQGDVTGLVADFRKYTEHTNVASKTNWGIIASWAAVFIATISGILYHSSLVLEQVNIVNSYQDKAISTLETKLDAKSHSAL